MIAVKEQCVYLPFPIFHAISHQDHTTKSSYNNKQKFACSKTFKLKDKGLAHYPAAYHPPPPAVTHFSPSPALVSAIT